VEEIQHLATLPGKEELFSKLLYLLQSPAQRLATVINATGRDLAVVIGQGVEKGKFGAPAAPAAEAPVSEAPAPEIIAEATVTENGTELAPAEAAPEPPAEA
jgi:large subunit ribosomal protein L10